MVCLATGFHAVQRPFLDAFQGAPLGDGRNSVAGLDQYHGDCPVDVVASLNIVMHDTEDSLRSRQFLSFLIAMSVWAFSLYFLYEQASEEFLETACVPASILIAHFFTVTRGKIVFWSFFTTVAVLVATLFIRIWNFL